MGGELGEAMNIRNIIIDCLKNSINYKKKTLPNNYYSLNKIYANRNSSNILSP